jgi:antitoxin MazE
MKTKLISIGNSKGVRIPSAVIKECGLRDELELRVENGAVVLSPARGVREGWSAAFERMAAARDDEQVVPDSFENDFDLEEWTW